MPKAYSYLRFSTPEQSRGDSFRRQATMAQEYVARNGLELDDNLTFHDLGVSGYHGTNVETGRLGDFLEAVEAGVVPKGSFLLVESLDRISRQAARKALRVLERIVEAGITLVTLSDGRVYDTDNLDRDPMSLMLALMIFIRSNEESATKARRLRSSWAGKREKASTKPLTKRGPAWLRLDGQEWTILEDRAAVVRRIYELSRDGVGQNAVAAQLNRENVPTFGDGTRRPGLHWHRSYIKKLLDTPAVVGTFVPHTMERENGRRKRTAQKTVPGYFPAVVDADCYEAVQALRMDSPNPQRGRHAARPVQNVLGGLAVCPLCSRSMVRVAKGARSRPSLVCSQARVGAGCTYRSVRLENAETALRSSASFLVAFAPAQADGGDLQDTLAKVQGNIAATSEELENLLREARSGSGRRLGETIRELENDLEALRATESDIWERIGATQGPMLERRLATLQDALEADPFDPAAANLALRRVLSRVVVNYRTGQLELEWLHGGSSAVMFAMPEEEVEVETSAEAA